MVVFKSQHVLPFIRRLSDPSVLRLVGLQLILSSVAMKTALEVTAVG